MHNFAVPYGSFCGVVFTKVFAILASIILDRKKVIKHNGLMVSHAMKKIIIVLSTVALIAGGCMQTAEKQAKTNMVNAEAKSKNPDDLIRADETIFKKIFGDLNNDGREDCVIITKQTKKEAFAADKYRGKIDRNRRGILIALKKDEYYNTFLAVPDCFSSENEDGGVYFPPELSVQIEKGCLVIHYGHGRYGWQQYTFRCQNNRIELINYENCNMSGPVLRESISIDFLAKKKQTKTNTNLNAKDESEEVIKKSWECIKIDTLIQLTNIKDFDGFLINNYYSEINCK